VTSYWCEYAWLPGGLVASVRVDVTGDRIVGVSADVEAKPDDVRLAGVTLPGLANTHSHAFHRALRGRTHGGGGTFWTWRERMYAVASRLDPARYLALARAAYAEMALAGYTAVGEFHYVHHQPDGTPYADPNAMGAALIQAAAEAGVRLTLLNTIYLTGGLGPDGHLPLDAVQQRFSDGSVGAWASRVGRLTDTSMTRMGAAIHSVRAVPREVLADVVTAAGGRPLHVHLSEQPAENRACLAYYGVTPTALLEAAGALGPQTSVVHATHLSTDDISSLAMAGVTACFCPTTERDLADGIGPARALADAGARLALGSDQHAVVDPFEEARGLESHERLVTLERGRFTPDQLTDALSRNGYAALGWPDGGRLAAGALADFVTVRLDSPRTAGAYPEQIVYAATGSDLTTVVVGGQPVVSDGRHRLGDIGRLLADAVSELDDEGVS
jgi:formiminoglutamate deiminase